MKVYCEVCQALIGDALPAYADEFIAQHMHARHPAEAAPSPPADEEWQERSADFMIFDQAGDEVQGVLEGFEEIDLHDRLVNRARIRTADGMRSFLLTAQLSPLMLTIPLGTSVKVRYEGETKSQAGRRVKLFKVWTKGAK